MKQRNYIVFLPPKILNPESTCIISPVIPLDKSLIKNSAVSPTSKIADIKDINGEVIFILKGKSIRIIADALKDDLEIVPI